MHLLKPIIYRFKMFRIKLKRISVVVYFKPVQILICVIAKFHHHSIGLCQFLLLPAQIVIRSAAKHMIEI